MVDALSERNRTALELFAPVAPTYDRYARLLSFGQDGRWRAFLVEQVQARSRDTVLDVACGTGTIALALVRRYGCSVVGVDPSGEMLAEGRRRIARTGENHRVRLLQGRAEALPFEDASFDALTFGYLLRYVDDPAATLREIARVVRPGGRIAGLEFFLPEGMLSRALWNLYVDIGLTTLGRLVAPGWADVGRFLGPSIRSFYRRYPLERQLADWRAAGIAEVGARTMSLGGGVVIWGIRGTGGS